MGITSDVGRNSTSSGNCRDLVPLGQGAGGRDTVEYRVTDWLPGKFIYSFLRTEYACVKIMNPLVPSITFTNGESRCPDSGAPLAVLRKRLGRLSRIW